MGTQSSDPGGVEGAGLLGQVGRGGKGAQTLEELGIL